MSSYDEMFESDEMNEIERSNELTEAKEAKETNLNEELNLIENEILRDFETPEEYLLYYARVGNVDKLKKLFDFIDKEKMSINVNVKGKNPFHDRF